METRNQPIQRHDPVNTLHRLLAESSIRVISLRHTQGVADGGDERSDVVRVGELSLSATSEMFGHTLLLVLSLLDKMCSKSRRASCGDALVMSLRPEMAPITAYLLASSVCGAYLLDKVLRVIRKIVWLDSWQVVLTVPGLGVAIHLFKDLGKEEYPKEVRLGIAELLVSLIRSVDSH